MGSFVKFGKEEIRVEIQFGLLSLNLAGRGITDIGEIEGGEEMSNLEFLSLSFNKISEIKGLENLTNLKFLILKNNRITEIKNLEFLKA